MEYDYVLMVHYLQQYRPSHLRALHGHSLMVAAMRFHLPALRCNLSDTNLDTTPTRYHAYREARKDLMGILQQ